MSMTTGKLVDIDRHGHPIRIKARRMLEALEAIYAAGRTSEQSRALYMADMARIVLAEVKAGGTNDPRQLLFEALWQLYEAVRDYRGDGWMLNDPIVPKLDTVEQLLREGTE